MSKSRKVLWISSNINKEINSKSIKQIKFFYNFNIIEFKDAISEIKKIEFEETIIIISGELYIQFINKFIKNLRDIKIIPKIIIFTDDKEKFIKRNQCMLNIINHSFYNCGIKTNFDEILDFISNPIVNNKPINQEKDCGNFVFEYINCKEQLILPIL